MLKRLDLEEILISEQDFLKQIAGIAVENSDTDPFAFRNNLGGRDTHVAQTQRILANIQQRKNLVNTKLFENEESNPGTSGSKRKQNKPHGRKRAKKVRIAREKSTSDSDEPDSIHESDDEHSVVDQTANYSPKTVLECSNLSHSVLSTKQLPLSKINDSNEELPSILGSPVISSTLKPAPSAEKLSIFRFSHADDSDDDTIFDL